MSSNLDVVRGVYRAFAVGNIPRMFVEDGSTVVALGEYSGTYKATGKSFKGSFAPVWKFAHGKAVSFHQYTDTAVHLQPMQG